MDSSQVLKGVLDVAVLCVVSEEDCYGYELVRRLRELGLTDVAEASVYGTLRRLYSSGLLSCYVVASEDGPHRKYYKLTNAGSKSLLKGCVPSLSRFALRISPPSSRRRPVYDSGEASTSLNVRFLSM